jgi:F-type H+-transporting ATPase subunit b
MLFSVDGTFFVQLINFAIFFALVSVLFIKPVGRAIAERRHYLDSVIGDYDTYTKQIHELRGAAEARRAAARREADALVAAKRAEMSKEVETLNAEYAGRAGRIVNEAIATVQAEMSQARASEDRLVRELAGKMLERALATAVVQ